ncbi:MAG: response regulator [Nitrospirae bacterium]|nr:response regulator [Nitrospirota bacterium]
MKNVLIVDDERSFLTSLSEGLATYDSEFNTLTAENGKKAVETLNSTRIDLVVTDLKMPEMDGFELLAYMSRHHPDIPVIIMTAYGTPEIRKKAHSMGASQYLEKPLDFKDLVDKILLELAASSEGYLRGITLPTFLQLVEMEKKTCTLKVTSRGRVGYLYFNEGELIDAGTESETGEQAAYDIVCWDEAEIEIERRCRQKHRTIHTSLGHILMESFRLKDEKDRNNSGNRIIEIQDDDVNGLIQQEEQNLELSGKEAKMNTLKDILNEFTKLQSVTAVCLVGRDGFLLDSIARTGIDTDMVGAIASSGFGTAESMGRQLGKGALTMSMIEFENGPVMFSPVGENAFLVIVAERDANLGMIRLKLKKHCHELAAAASI